MLNGKSGAVGSRKTLPNEGMELVSTNYSDKHHCLTGELEAQAEPIQGKLRTSGFSILTN